MRAAGMLAPRPADRLPRLAHGLGGDGAGVDEDGVGEPGLGGRAPHDLGFQRVQPAAEGEDVDALISAGACLAVGAALPSAPASRGSSVPSNSVSTGPVIQTWPSSRHSTVERAAGQRHGHACWSVSFLRIAATAAAQAAVPQALVMPTPRSQVLHRDRVARRDVGERDVGALGEDRMVLEQRPEAGEVVGVDVVDPEDRVRVAHVDRPTANAGSARRSGRSAVRWRGCRGIPRRAESRPSRSAACPCRR